MFSAVTTPDDPEAVERGNGVVPVPDTDPPVAVTEPLAMLGLDDEAGVPLSDFERLTPENVVCDRVVGVRPDVVDAAMPEEPVEPGVAWLPVTFPSVEDVLTPTELVQLSAGVAVSLCAV